MLGPLLLLPFLPGAHGNGTASQDSVLYQQFLSGEHGMAEGIPNLALAAMVIAPLLLMLLVSSLYKKWKAGKNEVKEICEAPSAGDAEEEKRKKHRGIFEEIEDELEKHEAQKRKLHNYLKFLATRDGGNILRTNRKRAPRKTSSDEESNSEDEDEKIERIETQRQSLSTQLKAVLQTNTGTKAAKRDLPAAVLD